jgi:hypothetical protein
MIIYLIIYVELAMHSRHKFAGKHSSSVLGRIVIYRDRQGGCDKMLQDYLADDPTCDLGLFSHILS